MERVAIYNRCSTEEESQRNALAAQAAESREIAGRMGWMITEQYIESQTGTVAYKRGEYQRLLSDMERDRFDIVMIKSIDRLTRSAKDWYFFLGRLTENKLRLYIYIEGKYYTPDDNLISGIKAILAEDFSRELSKKIKNAHRRRQEKGSGLNITCEMFGWDKKEKDCYEINEREAAYYRMAFRLAGEGKGFYSISNLLYDLGARTRSGQKISEAQWRKMLYTPRAHGTMVLNTRSYNFDVKRYEKVPQEQWVFLEGALPPIVSKEYQEEVLKILKRRARGAGRKEQRLMGYAGKYELSHKLVCAECGNYYYRSGSRKTEAREGGSREALWKCSGFLKNGRKRGEENPKGCDNRNVDEGQVFSCLQSAFKEQFTALHLDKEELLAEFMEVVRKALHGESSSRELERAEKERDRLIRKRDLLTEKLLAGVIDDQQFRRCNERLKEGLSEAEERIFGINQKRQEYNDCECRLEEIERALKGKGLLERAGERQMLRQVDSILVYRDGRFLPRWKQEPLA